LRPVSVFVPVFVPVSVPDLVPDLVPDQALRVGKMNRRETGQLD
jgi:hypothetical protein